MKVGGQGKFHPCVLRQGMGSNDLMLVLRHRQSLKKSKVSQLLNDV